MRESFVYFIHEALGSLAAPKVRNEVIRSALRLAAADEVPTDSQSFARFVRGPLRATMLSALGTEITDSVSAELEHMLRVSSHPGSITTPLMARIAPDTACLSGSVLDDIDLNVASEPDPERTPSSAPEQAAIGIVNLDKVPSSRRAPGRQLIEESSVPESTEFVQSERPRSQAYARGTARALGMTPGGSPPHAKPRVFVASHSEKFLRGLAHFLEYETVRIDDVMSLLTALGSAEPGRSVIVLDCRKPSIRPIALAALADELPASVQVVLWGASTALRYQLTQLSPSASAWLSCSEDDDLQSVALRCEQLVG